MNQFAKRVIVALALCLVVVQTVAIAQNLGAAPQVNVAVQGQTGAQPEGAFLNFVNWIGSRCGSVATLSCSSTRCRSRKRK